MTKIVLRAAKRAESHATQRVESRRVDDRLARGLADVTEKVHRLQARLLAVDDSCVAQEPIRVEPIPVVRPWPGPQSERLERIWEIAMEIACPECRVPAGRRCLKLAPGGTKTEFRETKHPHWKRLS